MWSLCISEHQRPLSSGSWRSTTWIYPVAYVLLLRHRRCFRAWGFSPSRAYTPVRPSVCLSVSPVDANFRGRGSSSNEFWRQKTTVPGLSRYVVCVILRLAVLIQYRRVTHTHTDRHTMIAITRASLAPRG